MGKKRINEILMATNNFEISTQLGRLDASHGFVLTNDEFGDVRWKENMGISGAARKIEMIRIDGNQEFIVTMNNDAPIFLVKKQNAK